MSEIFVDPELESYLNALSSGEDVEFEKDLLAAGGPDEPIKIWKDNGAIVDGHRRYKACIKHNLPFNTREIEFETIEDVKRWMCRRQRFRRNLTDLERAQIDARLVELEHGAGNAQAMKRVAEETGKSIATVSRSVTAANALDALTPKARLAISSGRVEASIKALVDLSHLSKEEKKQVSHKLARSNPETLAEAIKSVAGNLIPKKPNRNMARVQRADAAMPEAYMDDAGVEVPKELWDVFRARGDYYQIANDMTVLKGRLEVLAKTVQCESTEDTAKEIEELRLRVLGLMPSRVKGKHWINAAIVRGTNG